MSLKSNTLNYKIKILTEMMGFTAAHALYFPPVYLIGIILPRFHLLQSHEQYVYLQHFRSDEHQGHK